MKTFFKDYGELCKTAGNFYKKHWFGTIVMNVVVSGVMIAVTWPKELKEEVVDNIRDKFKKGDKVES